MICRKCKKEVPDGAFCNLCGTKQEIPPRNPKKRGNGQGSVMRKANGKYMAVVTLSTYYDDQGKYHRKTRQKTFDKKTDALLAIPSLFLDPKKEEKKQMTFKQLFDAWLPTHRAGDSTLGCYKAAIKYFEPVWRLRMSEIDIDDLQDCLDSCPQGKRTRQNMKSLCGLMYKYGIPRKVIPENLNLSPFLIVEGEGVTHRDSFTEAQIEMIRKACGKIPHAEDIYCMIYTGFRPSEFLALTADSYDKEQGFLVGGSKTEAGKNRTVTISPKIKKYIDRAALSPGVLFCNDEGKAWTLEQFTDYVFYPTLESIGIENPMVEIAGGKKRHKYTPHTCRHTFATLLKRINGSDKDKQELIGHASPEMLRYYQDVELDDLRRITDAL